MRRGGLVVSASNFQPEGRRFEPGLCRRGGNLAVDLHPIQGGGGGVILSVASCYRNRVKFCEVACLIFIIIDIHYHILA